MTETTPPRPRVRRRETHYPRHLRIAVTVEMSDALEAAADADQVTVSVIARDAIGRGLPLVADARRRQRRRDQQRDDGH